MTNEARARAWLSSRAVEHEKAWSAGQVSTSEDDAASLAKLLAEVYAAAIADAAAINPKERI